MILIRTQSALILHQNNALIEINRKEGLSNQRGQKFRRQKTIITFFFIWQAIVRGRSVSTEGLFCF